MSPCDPHDGKENPSSTSAGYLPYEEALQTVVHIILLTTSEVANHDQFTEKEIEAPRRGRVPRPECHESPYSVTLSHHKNTSPPPQMPKGYTITTVNCTCTQGGLWQHSFCRVRNWPNTITQTNRTAVFGVPLAF